MCLVWYQNCKNKWIGKIVAITIEGTPKKAAGNNKKVNKLTKEEIDWRKAQAKLNSSLL